MSASSNNSVDNARLSRISTRWSLVAEAHAEGRADAAASRRALFERYAAAGYQYLLGAVRDEEAAEELCHEFAVRFLGGDFHRANPDRGRFRDYIRKSLINLANDYHRTRRDQPHSLPQRPQIAASADASDADRSFEDCLRAELLDRTWKSLESVNPNYHAVLYMRVFEPDLSSSQIAEEVNRRTGKSLTSHTIRKTLERARTKFAELLLEEVSRASESGAADDLRSELEQLDLLKYCQTALDRRSP